MTALSTALRLLKEIEGLPVELKSQLNLESVINLLVDNEARRNCLVCDKPLELKYRGSFQKFCSTRCRMRNRYEKK